MSRPRGPVWLDLAVRLRDDFAGLLPDVAVSLGQPVSLSSGDYLAVCMSDPTAPRGPTSAGDVNLDWAGMDVHFGFDESGTLACGVWSWNGSDEMEISLRGVEAVQNAIIGHLRNPATIASLNADLGVWECHLESIDPDTDNTPDGAIAYGLIRIAYQAHI